MVDYVEEPQGTKESSRDAKTIFTDKVLDKMEEFASEMASLKAENVEMRDTKWQYAQTEKDVKEIGATRDQGLEEILKLQKSLDDA